MSWEPLELFTRSGQPLSAREREIILRALERAVQTSETDIEGFLKVAHQIGLNSESIRDLSAYTNAAFFRLSKSKKIAAQKAASLLEPLQEHHVNSRASSTVPSIDSQILFYQLLDRLNGLDREIYLLRLKGNAFSKIDETLSLKAGTSENRYREAARRLTR
jgi:hypothetical protein